MNFPSKREIEEAMEILSRHPTPTDFVALALNVRNHYGLSKIKRCDFILTLSSGLTIHVRGNDIVCP